MGRCCWQMCDQLLTELVPIWKFLFEIQVFQSSYLVWLIDIQPRMVNSSINQCWLLNIRYLGNRFQLHFNQITLICIQQIVFENDVCQTAASLSRPQCAKTSNDIITSPGLRSYLLVKWVPDEILDRHTIPRFSLYFCVLSAIQRLLYCFRILRTPNYVTSTYINILANNTGAIPLS